MLLHPACQALAGGTSARTHVSLVQGMEGRWCSVGLRMQLELLLQSQEVLHGRLLLPGTEKGQDISGLFHGVEGERKLIFPFLNHSTTPSASL